MKKLLVLLYAFCPYVVFGAAQAVTVQQDVNHIGTFNTAGVTSYYMGTPITFGAVTFNTVPVYQTVVNIAALKSMSITASVLNGYAVQVTGYYTQNDGGGGVYVWNSTSTSTDNGGTIIQATGVVTGRWLFDGVPTVATFGAYCDGTHDDTAAISNAITALSGKDVLVNGTPLISSTITLPSNTRLIFSGGKGNTTGALPTSYLLMKASMSTAGIVAQDRTSILGGGVAGQNGNTGVGIWVKGNSVTLRDVTAYHAGSDGIVIGVSADSTNVNSWLLDNCTTIGNGRYGVYIDSNHAGSPNANGGLANHLFTELNTSHGLYCDNSFENTFVGILSESNTGDGIYMGKAVTTYFYGGDVEGNSGNAVTLTSGGSYTVMHISSISGAISNSQPSAAVVDHTSEKNTGILAWTPVLVGGSSSGTGTYTSQLGQYTQVGKNIFIQMNVTWTAHTGTGQLCVSSVPSGPSSTTVPFVPLQCTCSGITLSSGQKLVGLLNTSNNRIQFYVEASGSVSALAVPASGTIYLSGSYVGTL